VRQFEIIIDANIWRMFFDESINYYSAESHFRECIAAHCLFSVMSHSIELRAVVKDLIDKHLLTSAAFLADKIAALTSSTRICLLCH